jgi:hypothetical protein
LHVSEACTDVGSVTVHLREWLVKLFITSIERISKEEDRLEVIHWLTLSREVIRSGKPMKDKLIGLYRLMDAQKAVKIIVNGVVARLSRNNVPIHTGCAGVS